MPRGVGDQRRQVDRSDPFRDAEAEQCVQQRDGQNEHQQLPELDTDIEREKRRGEVRAGELKGSSEKERKPEAVDKTESEGDDPPSTQVGADDVLERHVQDGDRDQRFDERWKPKRVGRVTERGCDQRGRMGDRERGDDHHQRSDLPERPERDDETQKKQQVIGAFQDMEKAQLDEAESDLAPIRIERHPARVSGEIERTNDPVGWNETDNVYHVDAQPLEARVDGELGTIRFDGVVEQDVEDALFPIDVGIDRQRLAHRVGERVVIASERGIGWQRHADGGNFRSLQVGLSLVELDVVGNP